MTESRAPGTARTARRGTVPAIRARVSRDGRRAGIFLLIYVLLFGAVGFRLVQVQVVKADEYAVRGAAQRARTIALPGSRGRLYDRDGDILATSVDAATIYADPRAFISSTTPEGDVLPPAGDVGAVSAALAPMLGRDAGELATLLRKDAHFVYLGRQLDFDLGVRVRELELPGIGVLTEPKRVYPAGQLAGQVVGFTGIDGNGLFGLEQQHDEILRGVPGELAIERAPGGLTISSGVRELRPAQPGSDLVLTIDREIQHAAETAAADAVTEFSAKAASVMVMDAMTGEVLAMASSPGFDPNAIDGSDRATWRNRAVTDVFEPGSVQKAITAAAALEEGVVTPETTLTVEDRIKIGPKTFSDSHRHPPETMTFSKIIEVSSNIGTIKVAEKLGADKLAEYLDAFGFGKRMGVAFPGESRGLVLPVENWWSTSLPTIAIGQGIAVTLLQTASFYATIANGGEAIEPRIVRGTVGDDGKLAPSDDPGRRRVISETTSAQLRAMLSDVVNGEDGTGKAAQVPGYEVAGKTGTARKPSEDSRGYSGKYTANFVGFAPAEDPRLVVAVMVDEPTPIWGGVVAAPVFSKVMGFALQQRRVAPTEPAVPLDEALAAAEQARAIAAAEAEGPATAADQPGSPPAGSPVGGDGTPAAPLANDEAVED